MSNTIIKVEGLGKRYLIGHEKSEQYTAMRDVIVQNIKGAGKSLKRLFSEAGPSVSGDEIEEFWALKDLDFEIKQGDAVGVIGRNGAGKSTLLKVLSRITEPTKGRIEITGRMASLLEVGTGFHPELTGRENIFLNGAIIGMTRAEIKRKFDEIVDFSGVEQFLDTPVKRYSSGMYVRLAFAVAAHLDSEILIIDEVLAVGDAEFQKKCLGKMDDVTKSDGRTVIFVSHNMAAVSSLCTRGLFLNQGRIAYSGGIDSTIKKYFEKPVEIDARNFLNDSTLRRGHGEMRFTSININNGAADLDVSEDVNINFEAIINESIDKAHFTLRIFGGNDGSVVTSINLCPVVEYLLQKGTSVSFDVNIPKNTFRPGLYSLYIWIGRKGELASENYHYDCIDSLFTLNYVANTDQLDLYYDPLQPMGVFNGGIKIDNIKA